MHPEKQQPLIYDWNLHSEPSSSPFHSVTVLDSTLRDGLQSPSVLDPSLPVKRHILRQLHTVGVEHIDLGFPFSNPRNDAHVRSLVETIRDEHLSIKPSCIARTLPKDIDAVLSIAKDTGVEVEVLTYVGTSPVRLLVEKWDEEMLEKRTRAAVKKVKNAAMPCLFATEDTIRSKPETIRRLFMAALEEGADRLCLCDTVGHATAEGVNSLVRFTQDIIKEHKTTLEQNGEPTKKIYIDWHGHSDRGLGLSNALAAVSAGVDRVHACVLGIGERVGNTSLDLLLVNLRLHGALHRDLHRLTNLVQTVAEACDVNIQASYPVFGRDAFRTATGVHAAAVVKALESGDAQLADIVYSGVPAKWFGREQEVEVGHMGGDSNIRFWLKSRGLGVDEELVRHIKEKCKTELRVLTNEEVHRLVVEYGQS